MRHHHESDAVGLGHLQHGIKHLARGRGVQIARRLVCKDNLWLCNKSARNAHTLLLSAGHLRRLVVRAGEQTHFFQFFTRQLFPLLFPHAFEHQRQGHVFRSRHGRQKIVALENEPQVLLAEIRQFVLCHCGNIMLANQHPAFGGLFQPCKLVEQCGFAAAGSADDTAHLPFADFQADVVQRDHLFLAYAVYLAQVLYFYNGCHEAHHLFLKQSITVWLCISSCFRQLSLLQ